MRSVHIVLATLWLTALLAVSSVSAAPQMEADPVLAFAKNFPSGTVPLPCVLHAHGRFSDGLESIDRMAKIARATGAAVLVMTEHLDCIELTEAQFAKSSWGTMALSAYRGVARVPKERGFENYVEACRAATVRNGILVVPGIEVALGGDSDCVYDPAPREGGDNDQRVLHLLGIGYASPQLCRDLSWYLGLMPGVKPRKTLELGEAQDHIAAMMEAAGLAVVVAHPYLRDTVNHIYYTVYKDRLAHVHGVEFFNAGGFRAEVPPDDEGSLEALGLVKRKADQGGFRQLVPTAGCDYHFGGDYRPFYRITILGLAAAPTCRPELFLGECQMVSEALRDPCATVFACSPDACQSKLDNGRSINMYQGGLLCDPEGVAIPNVAVYVHRPTEFMVRLMPERVFDPMTESVDAARQRVKPFLNCLVVRASSPVGDRGALARFVDARIQTMVDGDMAVAPPYTTVFPAPGAASGTDPRLDTRLDGGITIINPDGTVLHSKPIPIRH